MLRLRLHQVVCGFVLARGKTCGFSLLTHHACMVWEDILMYVELPNVIYHNVEDLWNCSTLGGAIEFGEHTSACVDW